MTQLLQNAAYGTALILAAAILRRVLKGRLIPEARLCLWAVCLFRLLTPAAPESALSLWGLSRLFQPRQTPAAPAPVTGAPQFYELPQTAPAPQPAPGIPWETVLLAVWLAVGIVLAVRYVLSWTRTRRAVACAIPLDGSDPRYTLLPKCARLREGPMEGAPLTFGAVKPTVVLSPGLDGDALDCVLAHEGIHARRRDNLWHYAMALALVVHWWNPAVWLMARLLRRDIELSCDRAALKKLGAERRAVYANTLVTLATQGDGPAFCQTFGRKAAEERIRSVMKFKKTSVIGVVLSLALVLAVTAAFASEPKEPDTYDSVKVNTSVELGDVTLTGDAAKYASQLHAGMTRDEVHQLLGEPHSMLSGLYGDIYVLDKLGESPDEPSFDDPAFFIYYDYGDFNGGVSRVDQVTYRVCDGQHIVLIQSAGSEDQPAYQDISDYKMVLPEVDENGVSRVYDDEGNLIAVGEPRYAPEDSNLEEELKKQLEAAWLEHLQAQILEYLNSSSAAGPVRVSSGLYDLCKSKDCDVPYDHFHLDGKVVRVYYENPGLLCAHPDCDNEQPHEHDGVQYAGKAGKYVILNPELEPVPSAAP